tara:strand:+ start:188 stop:460 length:273 start_codon:yes stop_codon:yes gene_type:complete
MQDLEKVKQRHNKRKQYIESKKNVPCADCGGTFPEYCMDFHHIGEKNSYITSSRKGFSQAMQKYSMKKIDEEISKCVVICANCHRIRHHA